MKDKKIFIPSDDEELNAIFYEMQDKMAEIDERESEWIKRQRKGTLGLDGSPFNVERKKTTAKYFGLMREHLKR